MRLDIGRIQSSNIQYWRINGGEWIWTATKIVQESGNRNQGGLFHSTETFSLIPSLIKSAVEPGM
jgi:hypothetical protein